MKKLILAFFILLIFCSASAMVNSSFILHMHNNHKTTAFLGMSNTITPFESTNRIDYISTYPCIAGYSSDYFALYGGEKFGFIVSVPVVEYNGISLKPYFSGSLKPDFVLLFIIGLPWGNISVRYADFEYGSEISYSKNNMKAGALVKYSGAYFHEEVLEKGPDIELFTSYKMNFNKYNLFLSAAYFTVSKKFTVNILLDLVDVSIF